MGRRGEGGLGRCYFVDMTLLSKEAKADQARQGGRGYGRAMRCMDKLNASCPANAWSLAGAQLTLPVPPRHL
jgi:hypothetical protein